MAADGEWKNANDKMRMKKADEKMRTIKCE